MKDDLCPATGIREKTHLQSVPVMIASGGESGLVIHRYSGRTWFAGGF